MIVLIWYINNQFILEAKTLWVILHIQLNTNNILKNKTNRI